MDKKELIKKLRENERLNLDSPYDYNRGCGYGYENARLLVERLEPDKVEVNEEQARLLKKYENEPLFSLIGECSEKEEELLARARLCGYTFNPKRWVVRQGGSEVWYLQGFRNSLDGDIVKHWCSYEGCIKFTNKSKAEAVATLVEGSVEEEK